MNEVAIRNRELMPTVSASLAAKLQRNVSVYAANGQHDTPFRVARPEERVTPAQAVEAAEAVAAMDRAPPFSVKGLTAWLRVFAALPNAPVNVPAYAEVVALALAQLPGRLPAAALSPKTAGLGLLRWKFWPTPQEVAGLLGEAAAPWNEMRDRLRHLADTVFVEHAPEPERGAPTEAEKAAISGVVRKYCEEVKARNPGRPERQWRQLTPEQVVLLRKQGGYGKAPA